MKYCKNCGAAVADEAIACQTCGAPCGSPIPLRQNGVPASSPEKKKGKGLRIALAVFTALVLLFLISRCGYSHNEPVEWPTGALAQMIPTMNRTCDSVYEHDDYLTIAVSSGIEKSDYNAYVSSCEERGFVVDAKKSNDRYTAYNAEGYKLDLLFEDFSEPSMDIKLETPKTSDALSWPTTGLATLIPNPEKEKGSIPIDSSSQLSAYIGEVSESDYHAYVDACINAGFNIDYSKNEQSFNAKNESGDSLYLTFEGFNTMFVSMYAADKPSKPTDETQEAPSDSNASGANNAVGDSNSYNSTPAAPAPAPDSAPDFRSTMDEYEKFIDSYVAFMDTYSNSNDAASMALDYAKMVEDYTKMAKNIEAIDESTLAEEDYQYYLEVMTRVNDKLAAAAV